MATTVAMAQEGPKRENHRPEKRHMEQFTPEQMATLETKKLTLALDLSENQQKQVLKFKTEQATKRKAQFEKFKAEKDKGVTFTQEQRFEMRNKMLDEQIATKNKMKSILNEKQFEEWSKMKKHHFRKRKMKEREQKK